MFIVSLGASWSLAGGWVTGTATVSTGEAAALVFVESTAKSSLKMFGFEAADERRDGTICAVWETSREGVGRAVIVEGAVQPVQPGGFPGKLGGLPVDSSRRDEL